MNPNINSKFNSQKIIIEDAKNNVIYSKNQKYFYHSSKKQNNKIPLKKIIKNKKRKSKEYLRNLCKNLINKSKLFKYYRSNTIIPKKPKINAESLKSKRFKKHIEKKTLLEQSSNNINSFKIILFACDY